MNLRRFLLLTLLAIFAFSTTNAKIAIWAIQPQYDELKRHHGDLFLYRISNKWGVIKSDGTVVTPPQYDYVTDFVEGHALLETREGNRIRLQGVLDSYGVVKADLSSANYYIDEQSAYFSEGKLVVCDQLYNYGFINTTGKNVVRCQFQHAEPFHEGLAAVTIGKVMLYGQCMGYINESFDLNANNGLLVKFHYGILSIASSFSNGYAVVGYLNKYAIIGKDGKVIRKIKTDEFTQLFNQFNAPTRSDDKSFTMTKQYNITQSDGRYGISEGQTMIAKEQFERIDCQYSDGTMIARKNGLYGLIRITDGMATLHCTAADSHDGNEVIVDNNGRVLNAIVMKAFLSQDVRNPRVVFDYGDGNIIDDKFQMGDTYSRSLTVCPVVENGATTLRVRSYLENDGILLAEMNKTFTVIYPTILRVTQPGPAVVRAQSNKQATFSSTIFNDSRKDVTVTAIWSTGKQQTITIPAGGSRTIYASKSVTADHTETVSIYLSTGESATRNIRFKSYF